MDEETIRAFATVVETSLERDVGMEWLKRTHSKLFWALSSQKFNTQRAIEMYAIVIERAVLANMGHVIGPTTIKILRESGITYKMATELSDQFKEASGAIDQRRARRGLLAMIIGL